VVLYDDALVTGWKAQSSKATGSLSNSTPVLEGKRSIALTVMGTDGWLCFLGQALNVTGKTHLKFSVHGGAAGGQALRVRSFIGDVQQPSVNMLQYATPKKNGWVEVSIPLADLKVNGSLNGVKFGAGSATKKAYLDNIRVE